MTTEQPTPVLDDLQLTQTLDKRNMLRLIRELPEQCETALGIGRSFRMEALETRPNVIYISGVGASGCLASTSQADIEPSAVSGKTPENAAVLLFAPSWSTQRSMTAAL